MSDDRAHTVKAYDEDLRNLNSIVGRMGGLVELQFDDAIGALLQRDPELAEKVRIADKGVDQLEQEIDTAAVRFIALRHPMGADLRNTLSVLRIAADLERIGDHAKSIAKRALTISSVPRVPAPGLDRMARCVQEMIKDVLDANLGRDTEKALDVWRRDAEVDQLYDSLIRELLTYMMEDPRYITGCTHLLFVAANIERVGDHTTNIADATWFQVTGEKLEDHIAASSPGFPPAGEEAVVSR